MDDLVLSRAEAGRLEYTLTLRACSERLTVGSLASVRELVDLPVDDPRHLPSVRIPARRGHAHRVRPQDLEQLVARVSAPTPLPTDAVSKIAAIAILAGQHVPSKPRTPRTPYVLWKSRLRAAARDGRVTEYAILGLRRYSTAELEAEKARLDAACVNGRPARRRMQTVRVKAAETEGLVTARVAAGLAGVRYETARDRWGPQQRFGARKIGGQWFFERAQIEARPVRARQSRRDQAIERPCAGGCGKTVRRTPSQFGRNKNGKFYCMDCWRQMRAEVLRAALADIEAEDLYMLRSEGQVRRFQGERGAERRAALAEIVRAAGGGDRLRKHHRKPTSTVTRLKAMYETRFGVAPTSDQLRAWKAGANQRKALAMGRSQAARELKDQVIALWSEDLTQMEIANMCHATPQRIGQIARNLGLPPRPRGRRRRM